jgi:lipopolysaccharide transport system ATP-binding protein
MSHPIISVHGLGKDYRLGAAATHNTLRDHIAHGAKSALNFFRQPAKKTNRVAPETFWALKDVNFEVRQGDGAGKSTLLKILSQITEPTEGEVRMRGRVASLLEVGTGFHPELSGRENIFLNGAILGMTQAEIRRKFDEIVAFAEVERFLDTPVKHYSSGMYVRLAFAVAAHLEPEILVVDEVLAVGDAQFQRKCQGKMRDVANNEGRTILLVSHHMAAISSLCDRGIVLEKGRIFFDGSATDAVQSYNLLNMQAMSPEQPNMIYNNASPGDGFAITQLAVVDATGCPKPHVVLRVTFRLPTTVPRCGVEMLFSSGEGARALLLASDPDSGFSLNLDLGEHVIECVVDRWPLNAGTFFVSGALTVPFEEYLVRMMPLGQLVVSPADLYRSGFTQTANRSLIATKHSWRLVNC